MGGVVSSQQQPIFQPQPQHLAASSFTSLHHDTYGNSIDHQDQQGQHQQYQNQNQHQNQRYASARPSAAARPQLFSDFFRRYELMIEL